MKVNSAPVLRLCLVALVVAAGVTSGDVEAGEGVAFMQHVRRVTKFPCSKPQPRAVSAIELLKVVENKTTYEYIVPAMTVLDRCDAGSGCCWQGGHMSCGPVLESEVSLEFKLVDPMNKKERMVWVKAKNHVKCSCKHVNSDNASTSGKDAPQIVLRQR